MRSHAFAQRTPTLQEEAEALERADERAMDEARRLGVHNRKGTWLWHGRFFEWLNRTWPHPGHRRFNGAVPASTPAYVDGCLHFHLPKTADLAFIE